mmetsp:Transcript_65958/g.148870  ORF Transcript_65958/g.148870 Transcript_65958/m.148870 type:complete len:214 (-) Transcript_65958:157-798(-)
MPSSRRLISSLTNLHDELSAFEIYFDEAQIGAREPHGKVVGARRDEKDARKHAVWVEALGHRAEAPDADVGAVDVAAGKDLRSGEGDEGEPFASKRVRHFFRGVDVEEWRSRELLLVPAHLRVHVLLAFLEPGVEGVRGAGRLDGDPGRHVRQRYVEHVEHRAAKELDLLGPNGRLVNDRRDASLHLTAVHLVGRDGLDVSEHAVSVCDHKFP